MGQRPKCAARVESSQERTAFVRRVILIAQFICGAMFLAWYIIGCTPTGTPDAAAETTSTTRPRSPRPGQKLERLGDEIMICGQLFHTGAPVVLWTDPGGYDAYRTERRFVPWEKASFE